MAKMNLRPKAPSIKPDTDDEMAEMVKTPMKTAVAGPRGPMGPRASLPKIPTGAPKGIRGTGSFKQLMNTLKSRG